jgi:preprotein translocase subunit SecG
MLSVIIIIHLMLVLALIGVVLLQKSEGGGLVSSTSGFLSSRGTANVLSRTTALLAAGFFVTSLALSWIASYEHRPVSVINTSGGPVAPAPPLAGGGSQPAAPPLSTGGGLLNQMEKGFPSLPSGTNPNFAPAPPSGPQVPQSK